MIKRSALFHAAALLFLLAVGAPATAAPGLTAPAKLDFGPVDVHFGGVPRQSVLVSNMSGEDVSLGGLSVSGPDGSDFRITNDACSKQLVKAFTSCSLEVEFEVGSSGAKAATLKIPSGESPLEVALSGTGITGTLSANPPTMHFAPIPYRHLGAHEEGEQGEGEQVTVTDSPDAGVQTGAVSITGPDASSFSIQYGSCATNLMAPNNSCAMGISFLPSSPGPKHATLIVAGDGAGGDLSIPLEGEGREGPHFGASTTQALLGDVALRSTRTQIFTITNTGDYPLFIQQSFVVTGTPLMFPKTSDTCTGQIVEPGTSCEITLLFSPTTAGEKSAAVLVITNSSPTISVLGVDGVGVGPPGPILTAALPRPPGPLILAPNLPDLQRLHGGTLTTGVIATCPGGRGHCSALSFLTMTLPGHASSRRASARLALLGSGTVSLRETQSSTLHIRMRPRALTRLRHRRHLSVTLTTVLRAGAATIATHTTTLVLHARPAPGRLHVDPRLARP